MLVSRRAGAAELIQDGIDGLLLKEPTDFEEIAIKLEALLNDRYFRRRLGLSARQTALDYTWEQVAQKTEDVYKLVLGAKGSQNLSEPKDLYQKTA